MRKHKKLAKRIVAISSIVLILVLTVAPLSVSAAAFSVESYNATTYWSSWVPSFSESDNLNLRWYDPIDVPFGTDFAKPFDRFVPNDLKDDLFIKGYYSDYPVALYGQEYNANFLMSMTFSIQLKKPLLLESGDRFEFFFIPFDNRFIDSATNTQVSFNRSQNCQMVYLDSNGTSTIPDNLYTSSAQAQNDNGLWVTKVLVENYGHSQIEVNALQISFITGVTSTYTGTANIGMIFSNVVRIHADPDIYPDYGDIENIIGSIDDAVNEWNDKLDDYFGGDYDVNIPDYSLIVGDGNQVIEDLEDNGLANFGSLMNDFASGAMQTDVVYGNMIVQNALLWIYSNPFASFMMAMSCALLCTRSLFGR